MGIERIPRTLLATLIELAMRGAATKTLESSTTELGKSLGISQQAASQHLAELEKMQFIQKKHLGKKTGVSLTPKGLSNIIDLVSKLERSLNMSPAQVILEGKVAAGVGEGAYYISLTGYRTQFSRILGVDPYPGTLNVKLNSQADVLMKNQLKYRKGLRIREWRNEKRTYGGATCFPATVNSKVGGFVCLIDRTSHDETIVELIAARSIKKALGLKDGDPITITVGT